MKTNFSLFTSLVVLLLVAAVDSGNSAEIKVNTALADDENIVFGIINEWEKQKDKDIILNSRDLKVLREILETGQAIMSPKGAHTDYAKVHRVLVTYWIYKKDSGTLNSHAIAITDTFEFLWHSFPAVSSDRLRRLLASKGIVFTRQAKKAQLAEPHPIGEQGKRICMVL